MAGCGYVCPQCEGKGFTNDGEACDWCSVLKETAVTNTENGDSSQD